MINILYSHNDQASHILIPSVQDSIDWTPIQLLIKFSYQPNYEAKAKETLTLIHPDKDQKVTLLGLGLKNDATKILRSFIHKIDKTEDSSIDIHISHLDDKSALNAVIGTKLGLINYGKYKLEQKVQALTINICGNKNQQTLIARALDEASTLINIMELVDEPANIKTPQYLADYATQSGAKNGFDVKVHDAATMKKLGLDAVLAVGQGSINPPVFIMMEYKPLNSTSTKPKLALVGKGITFDTGGLSIKPSANMGYMKSDMGGAAAVIGTIELVAKLQLPIHIVGIVPSAENSVDANSIRPGDVIGSYSNKSIEVIDTDAEGRLILADGLAYAIKNYEPEYLIDLATLTGNVIAALGYHAAGLFTENNEMAQQLSAVGADINERNWQMPMWDDYLQDMQSDIADLKNLSAKPIAGSITAAKFLGEFTEKHAKWTHIDIAGVAFADSEFAKMRTSTGYGVRLMTYYIERYLLD